MKSLVLTSLLLLLAGPVLADATDHSRPHLRELGFECILGLSSPTGRWSHYLKSDFAVGGQFSVGATRHLSYGFAAVYAPAEPKHLFLPRGTSVGDNRWNLLSGSLFLEHRFPVARPFEPFIAVYGGVQGLYIVYEKPQTYEYLGDFGISYGLGLGIRSRLSRRFGILIRARADNAPTMDHSGWFTTTAFGLGTYL